MLKNLKSSGKKTKSVVEKSKAVKAPKAPKAPKAKKAKKPPRSRIGRFHYYVLEPLEQVRAEIESEIEIITDEHTEQDVPLPDFSIPKVVETWVGKLEAWKDKYDTSTSEELRNEIEDWRDNLVGTNLENGQKFEELEECISVLENVQSEFESNESDFDDIISKLKKIDQTPVTWAEFKDMIMGHLDNMKSVLMEMQDVSFPGMF